LASYFYTDNIYSKKLMCLKLADFTNTLYVAFYQKKANLTKHTNMNWKCQLTKRLEIKPSGRPDISLLGSLTPSQAWECGYPAQHDRKIFAVLI